MPDVTTRSPSCTSAVPGTYSIRSVSPCPTTTPCALVRSMRAPAAALRSMSICTLAARALGRITRPTTPAGGRSLVDGHRPELGTGAGGDDFRRRRLQLGPLPQFQQLAQAAAALRL